LSGSSSATKKKATLKKKRKPGRPPKKAAVKKPTKKKGSEPKKESKASQSKAQAWYEKALKSKKFQGSVQIRPASKMKTTYYLRRKTGIMSIDLALGGGVHAGGHTQLFGAEAAGKNALGYVIGGEVQKTYGKDSAILLTCTELVPDIGFARMMGLHIAHPEDLITKYNEIRVTRGLPKFTAEELRDLRSQTGDVFVITAGTGDKALDGTAHAVVSGAFQYILIDSLGALLTPAQNEKDTGDLVYGGPSVMLTTFVNKIYPSFISLVCINQARALIGSKVPTARAASGAHAYKHGQLASLLLKKGQPIKAGEKSTKVIGHEVRWTLTKAKAGAHDGLKGEYNYFHVPSNMTPVFWKDVQEMGSQWGIDKLEDLVTASSRCGAVKLGGGGWYTWKTEDGSLVYKGQGKDEFKDKLVNDPELVELLEDSCLKAANLMIRYK
jgi:RecA/RadA recombinase